MFVLGMIKIRFFTNPFKTCLPYYVTWLVAKAKTETAKTAKAKTAKAKTAIKVTKNKLSPRR